MDYDVNLYNAVRNDDIVMENLQDLMLTQENKDRIGYIDSALEAMANPAKQAELLNKLFKDIQDVESIDFGKIPDSKGDITKYIYYPQMYQCIDILTKLFEGNPSENAAIMNKLHNILLTARGDFTFGFRIDNYLVKNVYNIMVTTLYELISICSIDATEYLRAKLSIDHNSSNNVIKKNRWVSKIASQFIHMYESGQWSTYMKSIKSGNNILPASEASIDFHADLNDAVSSANGIMGKLKDIKKNYSFNDIKNSAMTAFSSHKFISIVVILIAILFIARNAIKYFIKASGKLSDRIKTTTEIIKINAAAERIPSALEKQKFVLDKLEKINDTIEYSIIKSENAAKKSIEKDNREDYNKNELTSISSISGSDFEI